jgi:hypothetical protein
MTRPLQMIGIGAALMVWLVGPAAAQPEKTLKKCQQTSAKATAKLVAGRSKVLGKCLSAITKEIIAENAGSVAGVAEKCATGLRKLTNSEAPDKTLGAKLRTKVGKACDPAINARLEHGSGDVLGSGGVVTQKIEARTLEAWCADFGGTGTLTSVQDWIDCEEAAAECLADQQVVTQFPRILEWLAQLRTAVVALGATPEFTDAVAAIDGLVARLDSNGDGIPDLRCGPVALTATGQTTKDVTADDGDFRHGRVLRYVDNGDGTITDLNTGLMWEKKCNEDPPGATCPAEHDVDSIYVWSAFCSMSVTTRCSTDTDCPMGETCNTSGTIWEWIAAINTEGGTGFAGHSDWRVPSIRELLTLLDMNDSSSIFMSAVFQVSCAPPCSVTTCSCPHFGSGPWSSTTDPIFADYAIHPTYNATGLLLSEPKFGPLPARAVRGGS